MITGNTWAETLSWHLGGIIEGECSVEEACLVEANVWGYVGGNIPGSNFSWECPRGMFGAGKCLVGVNVLWVCSG